MILQREKAGESLIGIIVGIFILSIVILGVGKLISYSKDLTQSYNDSINLRILKNNTAHILMQLDTSKVLENEIFYIHKDTTNQEFKVFTGATNVTYKYIDINGNHISDVTTFGEDIYTRSLYIQREDTALESQNQIIKVSIKKLVRK